MPDIQSVKVTRSRDGDRQEKTPVKTLRDVFFKEQKLCSNIYLTADAGYGKTAFSKKLALAWCQAKQPDKNEERHFSKDEITAIGGFNYVFLVLLRDSSSECDIDKLILKQICSQLKTKHKFYEKCLATILSEETCLVILDGLDEWTHPLNSCSQGESKIPHQRVRENVAVLTTTRPWKLSVIGLHSNQIDQKLELKGLSDDSAKKLKKSVISHLYEEQNKQKIDKYENEFSMSVKESHKSDLTAIPLFLLYLIFLWYYKFKVGKSLADLYSSFIELLLSRTVTKEGITIPKTKTVQGNIPPPCFNDKELCQQFYTLLTTLGKLAFHTLFSEQKENMLVFDGRLAEKYLSKDELTFCLETGIITQSKVLGDVSLQQKTKVSFAHKTMQEFLAALYINSVTDQSSVQETVLTKCKCVKDILDMSKMLMFIEQLNTSEKNRSLCDNVRRKGRQGYDKLKDWLARTEQQELVEILECIEDGNDYTKLLESLHKKIEDEMGKESLEDKACAKMKSDLRDDLISFYKCKHRSVPLSPLLDDNQPLLKFYVMPDIQSVKVTRSRDGDRQEKTPVKTLRDVFFKKQKLCSNIYLTADAGYGKTAFSKKLALAWCQAKQPDKNEERHFSKDEITAMDGFSYVFLVLLRDGSSECDIDMLILNQICPQLKTKHKFYEECLATILSEETCLVILDGLDEWTHPLYSCRQGESKIPHQRVRENVAVLTTTRPWKLSVIGLHSNQIDQKLELEGLSDESAKKLKKSVISHLYEEQNKQKIDKYEKEFNMSITESHKSDLTAIPLFLLYLIFLWYCKFKVGKSLADLYSSFIELLLSRTVTKEGIKIPKTKTVQGSTSPSPAWQFVQFILKVLFWIEEGRYYIPPCFNDKELCKQFYTLLTTLGKLAFLTLFSEQKENMLVFDGCVAEKYLSKDELTFCLETGIITQSIVQGDVSLQQKTKVSFAHKTMQEFLAALYLNSVTDQKSVQETVLSKCKCIKDILDMSKMLMFIVSISANFSFSRELMKIINEDEITQEYRRSLQDGRDHPLKNLQDMYISCCKEIPRENEVNLCLQDVIIDRSCQQEEYRENLKRLTTRNKQNIRSVYIDMDYMYNTPYNTGREVIDYFSLNHLENVEKIHYRGREYSDDVILPWLNSSVKSLYLSCGMRRGSWSRSLCHKVTSLHKLEAIGIRWFNMGHSELRLLMDFTSRRDCLREIELESLSCTDHRESPCTGLDLSRLKSFRKLTLSGLELSSVIINMSSLEKCGLLWLSNPDLVLKFINSADNKLHTFTCRELQSSAAADEIVRTLRHSRHVRQIVLNRVTMEVSALGELVASVLELEQTVTVDIWHCTISPGEEFDTLKGTIKTSQRVRILKDDEGWFRFETKQNGC